MSSPTIKVRRCFEHPQHGVLCLGCVVQMMREERREALLQAANVLKREYGGLKIADPILKFLKQRANDEIVRDVAPAADPSPAGEKER